MEIYSFINGKKLIIFINYFENLINHLKLKMKNFIVKLY